MVVIPCCSTSGDNGTLTRDSIPTALPFPSWYPFSAGAQVYQKEEKKHLFLVIYLGTTQRCVLICHD